MLSDSERTPNDGSQTCPQLTYDVYTEDGIEERELPFVIGVLGEFAGTATLPPIEQREFVTVCAENFDAVIRKIAPELRIRVPNSLSEDDTSLKIELRFQSMDDFAPIEVARQFQPLRKLLELRDSLADLRRNLATNSKLDELIHNVLTDQETLARLKEEEQIP
jgi:type VI secretion system protein ImpB